MHNSKEVSEFLTSLRAALTPEKAGLTFYVGERRVAGLRREEAAQLSGVSTAYYTRMERGDLSGVSESVLHALARGLQLDQAQTIHLFDLAKNANNSRHPRQASIEGHMTARVGQLIDAMGNVPALAMNRLSEPVGSNSLGRALFPDLFPQGRQPLNHSRYLFLDPRSKLFYPDWETSARDVVSSLRLLVGQSQGDQALLSLVADADLIGGLNNGWAVANTTLFFERSGIGALPLFTLAGLISRKTSTRAADATGTMSLQPTASQLAYHLKTGRPRSDTPSGVVSTHLAMALSGDSRTRAMVDPDSMGVTHVEPPYAYRCPFGSRNAACSVGNSPDGAPSCVSQARPNQ